MQQTIHSAVHQNVTVYAETCVHVLPCMSYLNRQSSLSVRMSCQGVTRYQLRPICGLYTCIFIWIANY